MKKNHLIHHHNKNTNVTYLYWGHSTYIPGQSYPKVDKKCIGKIDEKGVFSPNKNFLALPPEQQVATGVFEKCARSHDDGTVSFFDLTNGKAASIFASLKESSQMTVIHDNRPIGVLLSVEAYRDLLEKAKEGARLESLGVTPEAHEEVLSDEVNSTCLGK